MSKMKKNDRELIRDMKRRWAVQCKAGELFCFLCGEQITSMKDCNADHWVPLALGGGTTEKNIKPAHPACNSAKGCMSPEEFLQSKGEVISKAHKRKGRPTKSERKTLKRQKRSYQKTEKRREDNLYTASYGLKQPYDIGTKIYYIKEDLSGKKPKFEIKEGIILGFTYKNTIEYALVKSFYINDQQKIDSELTDVIPLTKPQAIATKLEYEKLAKHILMQLFEQQNSLQH